MDGPQHSPTRIQRERVVTDEELDRIAARLAAERHVPQPENRPDAYRVTGYADDGEVVFVRYRETARLAQIAGQAMAGYHRVVRIQVDPVTVTVCPEPPDEPVRVPTMDDIRVLATGPGVSGGQSDS